jgi:ribonuclease E
MANKMLIDATHPEETRVVVLRGNRVEEFDFETAHRKQLRGNIYLAKVTRVEPSLQAAFVDYGGNRHGFLAFSEIHPDYYQIPVADRQALIAEDERAQRDEDEDDERGHRRHGRHRRRDQRRRASGDDTVQSEALGAEGPDAAAQPIGENVVDDPLPEVGGDEPSASPAVQAATSPDLGAANDTRQAAAIGETANPPTEAETAAPNPVAHSEPAAAADAPAGEPAPDQPLETSPAEPPEHVAEAGSDTAGPTEDRPAESSEADDSGGPGAEDEEEVVESVGGADAMEEVPVRAPRYRRQYKIQEVIKRRQVMLVQVVKEERGTKGAALTTYLSLAGRYCVLMPNTARGGGISRKITSPEDRKKLREIAEELQVPDGMGVILRTAGAARTKAEVKRDFEYLLRLWEQVRDLTLKSTAPMLVYEEGSLAKRSIRDLYTKDIEEIIVAGEGGYRDAKEFMRMLMPSHARNVKLYNDSQPVFSRYGIESQLDAMFSPTVQLRSGGYVVINQAEALVAIDVNSGRSTREHHIEDTALKTNVEAAEEIARQLRLRDLAGLIVIDFIDMDEKRNNRTVERRLKDALRNDRARIQVGRISHFGLLEMSRQRIRTSVLESSTEKCPHCGGTGHVRSVSSVALQLLRSLEDTLLKGATHNQIIRTRPEIALYVLNQKRAHLRALEERFRITVTVSADPMAGSATPFAIDRGEQVMTIEQAKALAAQYESSAPQLLVEEEPEAAATDGEGGTEAEDAREQAEPFDSMPAERTADMPRAMRHDDDHADRNGGDAGSRRRRRRRRRGRGGEGRETGQFPQGSRELEGTGQEQFAPDPNLAHSAERPEGEPAETEFAPHADREPRHNGEAQGSGDPRRRRRGRRGGRRNRRGREGEQPFADRGGEPPRGFERPYAETVDSSDTPSDSGYRGVSSDQSSSPSEHPTAAPPPPQETAPLSSPVTAQAEAPRRRSTVREPAPIYASGAAITPPSLEPQPAPQPAPAAIESVSSDDAAKPRRTGWWAKRLLGGDKS